MEEIKLPTESNQHMIGLTGLAIWGFLANESTKIYSQNLVKLPGARAYNQNLMCKSSS